MVVEIGLQPGSVDLIALIPWARAVMRWDRGIEHGL